MTQYTDPQEAFLGAIIVEGREDPDLAALVESRIRGRRPAAEMPNRPGSGDVQPKGSYKRFVVASIASAPPHPDLPISFAEVQFNAYGTDDADAWGVWAAVVKAYHRVGPRVKASGLGIYRSKVISGGEQADDPDTGQPYISGTIQFIVTTQAVA